MLNLQHDIIKKYLKLPLNTSWFITFKPSIEVVNRYENSKTNLTLKSFGSGTTMVDTPLFSGKTMPNGEIELNERDTIKLIFRMEILY